MRSKLLGAVLTGAALLTAGCGTPGPPEISVYADGEAIQIAPTRYCDVRVSRCEADDGAMGRLSIRPGQPVQISVPSEIAESPWLVNVQAVSPEGEALPVRQEFFSPGEAYAYTARPAHPAEQLLVVEVQQLGAAYFDDGSDERQLIARGVWALELSSGT